MRRLPAHQRRAELVDAAARVIARDGLAAASVRAIVAEADMPLGALHSVFTSREELLRTLIADIATTERQTVLNALESLQPTSIADMVRTGLDTYLTLMEQHPERELAVAELSLHGARHDPELAAAQWESYYAAAAESLERGAQLCGAVWTRPVDEIAQSLICTLDGITLSWLATRDGAALRRHIEFLAVSFAALARPADDVTASR